MKDIIDSANELAQREIDFIVANRPRPPSRESALECEDCGEPIPEQRRIAITGCTHCVDCQELKEKFRK